MEQRNIIKRNEYSGYTELIVPSGEIWMSESEMVDLFGVFIPKLRNAIKTLYKEEQIKPYEAERTIKKRDNLYVTVYNYGGRSDACIPTNLLPDKGSPQGTDGTYRTRP